MKLRRLFQTLLAGGLMASVLDASAASVTVFAAASLTDSLKEIAADYEKETGDKIVFNFAASSFLERQIEEGAPADIFFSADEAKMNTLQAKGLLAPETRKSRLSNLLVIVVPKEDAVAVKSPGDLAGAAITRVALADPKAVPAGIYAKKYFEQHGLWTRIEPKVVPTENVRGALAAVESGDVDAAVVYKTDAAISKNVKVACEIAKEDGPDISYPVALVKEAHEPAAAKKFLEYLDGKEAGTVFKKFGFTVKE